MLIKPLYWALSQFQTQQVYCSRDKLGSITEGGQVKFSWFLVYTFIYFPCLKRKKNRTKSAIFNCFAAFTALGLYLSFVWDGALRNYDPLSFDVFILLTCVGTSGYDQHGILCLGYAAVRSGRGWWRRSSLHLEASRNAANGGPSPHLITWCTETSSQWWIWVYCIF